MKNTVTIVLIISLICSLFSCNNKAEKVEAYNSAVTFRAFQDTSLTYSLTNDSLIIEFAKPPKIRHWYGEIYLTKSNPYDEIHIPFPNKQEDNLGFLAVQGNKIILTGFHIPSDSIKKYHLNFHAVPHFIGCHSKGEIYSPGFLFHSIDSIPNKLAINERVKDFNIISVDLVKLKKMPFETREFCRDSIKRAHGIDLTDVQIEQAEYNF